MNAKPNYTLVGLFVVLLTAALVFVAFWISMAAPHKGYVTYVVYVTESVAGLSTDSPVKYKGVDVGQVAHIAIDRQDPERVSVVLQLRPGTPVKEDTVATIKSRGFTGIAYIDLTGGTRASPPLVRKTGQPYPVIASEPSFLGRLQHNLPTLVGDVADTTRRLNALLDERNIRALSQALANLDRFSRGLVTTLGELHTTLLNARRASADLPGVVGDAKNTIAKLDHMVTTFSETGAMLKQTVEVSGGNIQRFTNETLPQAATMVDDLRQAAGNLRRATAQVEQDPSVVLLGPRRRPGPGE